MTAFTYAGPAWPESPIVPADATARLAAAAVVEEGWLRFTPGG